MSSTTTGLSLINGLIAPYIPDIQEETPKLSFRDLPKAAEPYAVDPLPRFGYISSELQESLLLVPALPESSCSTSSLTRCSDLPFSSNSQATIVNIHCSLPSSSSTIRPVTPTLVHPNADAPGSQEGISQSIQDASLDTAVKSSTPQEVQVFPADEVSARLSKQEQTSSIACLQGQIRRGWFRLQGYVQRVFNRRSQG